MNDVGIVEATETIVEEPSSSAPPPSFSRSSSHARAASLPGLWGDTAMCQSPPTANTATRPAPNSSTPLHPADDMVNQMGTSEVDDERLTEDQILALYSGRSPVMTTPIDGESFPFTIPASRSSPPATSSPKKSTPRSGLASEMPPMAPALPLSRSPSSSTGGGLTSLFRKGSKFVRRGDHGESSRSRAPATSPENGTMGRTGSQASTTFDLGPAQNPDSSRSAPDADGTRRTRTHVRQAASLEPTAWRQQFLKSGMMNMPRPAPKSASQGNLA
jgi:hypothetical protein